MVLLIIVVGTCGWVLTDYAAHLPDPAGLPAQVRAQVATHGGAYVPLADIPLSLQQAIVATEDETFYTNPGVSLEALGRAVLHNIQLHRLAEGGSTISQQLAKVMYLDGNDRSARRKLNDTLLGLKINQQLSKSQILELYLNAIYYGHGAYGVGQAAQVYFDAPVNTLDLAQCALLAGLPRAPSILDPYIAPGQARDRRNTVLSQMAAQGMITKQEAQTAAQEPILP